MATFTSSFASRARDVGLDARVQAGLRQYLRHRLEAGRQQGLSRA
ncbi:MAG: hypothetical protein ACYCWL_05490 [Thauera sp.]